MIDAVVLEIIAKLKALSPGDRLAALHELREYETTLEVEAISQVQAAERTKG